MSSSTTSPAPVLAPQGPPRGRRADQVRPRARPRARAPRRSGQAILVAGFAAIGLLVVYGRCPTNVQRPELYAEDGTVWFTQAYRFGVLHSLTLSHTGYLQTLPRLVADVGLVVPLRLLPLFYVVSALAVQVLPACFLVSRRMEKVIPSVEGRLVFAFAYLCVPNSQETNANLTNAQWHLAILMFLVVIATEGGWPGRIFDVLVLVVGGLTGPFAWALGPIAIVVYVVRRRRWSAVHAFLLTACAFVQGAVWFIDRGTRDHLATLGASVSRLIEIVGGEVVGGTIFGNSATQQGGFVSGHLAWCSVLFAVGACLVLLVMWRGPLELRAFNLFAVAMLAASLAAPIATALQPQWQFLTQDSISRYWYLPTCALLADILWAAGRLWKSKRKEPYRRWIGMAGISVLVLTVAFGVRVTFRYSPIEPRPDWAAEARAFTKLRPGRTYVFVETPPGWTFPLTKS